MKATPKLILTEATLPVRARRAARIKSAPLMSVHARDVLSSLLTYAFVQRLAKLPCECGHTDELRCWEHARDFPRSHWCHPCEADFLVQKGRLP